MGGFSMSSGSFLAQVSATQASWRLASRCLAAKMVVLVPSRYSKFIRAVGWRCKATLRSRHCISLTAQYLHRCLVILMC